MRSRPTVRSVPSREWKLEEVKENAVRAARKYLATLDNAAFGAASPVTPKFISRSEPAAQWTGAHKGHTFFAYANNYLIDTDHGVIFDVEATRAIRSTRSGLGARRAGPTRIAGPLSDRVAQPDEPGTDQRSPR